jgi:hypothetical protein
MAVTDALLTNAAYQVISRVAWQRAITLVVMDLVDVVENHPTDVIHSAGGLAIRLPTIVRQRRYVHVPGIGHPRGETATRAGVLKRDRSTCGYCGGKASTMDEPDRLLRTVQRREGRPDPGRMGPQAALDAGPAERPGRRPGTCLARPLAGGLTTPTSRRRDSRRDGIGHQAHPEVRPVEAGKEPRWAATLSPEVDDGPSRRL